MRSAPSKPNHNGVLNLHFETLRPRVDLNKPHRPRQFYLLKRQQSGGGGHRFRENIVSGLPHLFCDSF